MRANQGVDGVALEDCHDVSDCNPFRRFPAVGALKGETEGLQNAIQGDSLLGYGHIWRRRDYWLGNLLRLCNHLIA